MSRLDEIRERLVAHRHGINGLGLSGDVDALLAVVEALPRCAICGDFATKAIGAYITCDAHANPGLVDIPYAHALRALLKGSK